MGTVKDLTGQRFNRLIVVCCEGQNKQGDTVWKCKCDCGKTTIVRERTLKSGQAVSCGCYRRKTMRQKVKEKGSNHNEAFAGVIEQLVENGRDPEEFAFLDEGSWYGNNAN